MMIRSDRKGDSLGPGNELLKHQPVSSGGSTTSTSLDGDPGTQLTSEGARTTVSGRLFHEATTRNEKKGCLIKVCALSLKISLPCPRRVFARSTVKNLLANLCRTHIPLLGHSWVPRSCPSGRTRMFNLVKKDARSREVCTAEVSNPRLGFGISGPIADEIKGINGLIHKIETFAQNFPGRVFSCHSAAVLHLECTGEKGVQHCSLSSQRRCVELGFRRSIDNLWRKFIPGSYYPKSEKLLPNESVRSGLENLTMSTPLVCWVNGEKPAGRTLGKQGINKN
ncbi:hypothetical protein CSKR_103392 [Clonorchis sinensis]|uniref:Uncharacterized protein n=1 Tax=Clonorchis sinensis TaxID=79923 RepID=A0A3R7D5N1_CLOSI|nr:hypothetical protein CSKR_103392 [Clonorchis sinensis]